MFWAIVIIATVIFLTSLFFVTRIIKEELLSGNDKRNGGKSED